MKVKLSSVALPLAAVSLAFSTYALKKKPRAPAEAAASPSANAAAPSALPASTPADLESRLAEVEAELGRLSGAAPVREGAAPIAQRLTAVERSLARLQSAFDGISLREASEERDALFRGEDGHLKADEYFAAGKFAIAGEGYLAFLEEHPEHPDAYDILGRARDAFRRAGYQDKAIWAQEELIRNSGERQHRDVLELANLEKEAGRLDSAIAHAAEAAELAPGVEQALWHRMYWAWYHQLRDGDQVGLDSYRAVQAEIDAAGFTDGRLGAKVQAEIDRIESRATAQN